MKQIALRYLREFKFSVIPMYFDGKQKKPCIPWTPYRDRHPTEEEVSQWWTKWPTAMIGVVCGKISDFFVIDCDTETAYKQIAEHLSDTETISSAVTPRPGRHLYFRCPEFIVKSTVLFEHCDVKAEGGIAIIPPSKRPDRKEYKFLPGLEISKDTLHIPNEKLQNLLKGGKPESVKHSPMPQSFDDPFLNGNRDNALFSVALALKRHGWNEPQIYHCLSRLITSWDEEPDQRWINDKIASARKTLDTKERNLAEETREWALSSNGIFMISDIEKTLQITSRAEKKNMSKILSRLIDEKIIERYGIKNGCFRKVDNALEKIDWESASEEHLNIKLPLNITDYCNVNPSNIIIVAGCKDAGKTAFCINTAILNLNNYKINYYSNEMGDVEIKRRLKKVQIQMSINTESLRKINFYKRLDNFADIIDDEENTINIIDYVDVTKDPYLIGEVIKTIFAKLKKSVCLIALQKDYGKDLARGGASSLDKARIYITLERGKGKIVSGKDWANEHINPAGLELSYRLVQGCKFSIDSDWK